MKSTIRENRRAVFAFYTTILIVWVGGSIAFHVPEMIGYVLASIGFALILGVFILLALFAFDPDPAVDQERP